jgi:hypothetical protein
VTPVPTPPRRAGWPLLAAFVSVASVAACGPPPRPAPPPPPKPATQPASRPATQPASRPATQPASKPACNSWIVDYETVSGTSLRLANTPYGAGDGTYAIGPGTVRMRYADHKGEPAPGEAALLDLQLTTKFVVNTTAVGFKMRITTDGNVGFTPDECGVVARGTLEDDKVTWTERARGYRSTGTLHCAGVLCGKFGSPPGGRSQMSRPVHPVKLRPVQLHDGVTRLSLPFFEVERQAKPSQTVLMRVEARETGRRCVVTPPCAAETQP